MSFRSVALTSLTAFVVACTPEGSPEATDASATADESSSTSFDPGPDTTTTTTGPVTTDEPDATTTEEATTTDETTATDDDTTTTDAPEPICGDGHVDPGEACDDGPDNDNTEGACTELCALPTCGDGFVQEGEACDLGVDNHNTGACTNFCALPACGDGFVQAGEVCDEGEANHDGAGGCHPETCQIVVTTCGDGALQEDEECDASPQPDLAEACTNCYFESRVIFASSAVYSANFGGLAQADGICQDLAWAAKLANPERFIAWLSAPGTPMASRLEPLPFNYVRTDGVPIAEGWEALVSGQLKAAITRDEYGKDATELSAVAWTGTLQGGGEASTTCLGWASKDSSKKGLTGSILDKDAKWTSYVAYPCSQWVHLYCIET